MTWMDLIAAAAAAAPAGVCLVLALFADPDESRL
jgi:hypothetical protein